MHARADFPAGADRRPSTPAVASVLPWAVLLLWPLALWAFWPRYLSQPRQAAAITHVHAVLGSAWMLLLVVQPWLARARRRAAHRWIGRAGVLVGAGFVASGILAAHRGLAAMDPEQFARDGFFVYMPLAMTAIFAAALGLGIAFRRSPAVHASFMASTLLPLLDPVFARILGFHFPPLPAMWLYQAPALLAMAAVLALLAWRLPRQARGRHAFVAFAAGAALVNAGFYLVEGNPAWLAFVSWFRALPLG